MPVFAQMTQTIQLRSDADPCLQNVVVVIALIAKPGQLDAALLVWLNDLQVQRAWRERGRVGADGDAQRQGLALFDQFGGCQCAFRCHQIGRSDGIIRAPF